MISSTNFRMYIIIYPPSVAVKENEEWGGLKLMILHMNFKNEDNEDIEEFED